MVEKIQNDIAPTKKGVRLSCKALEESEQWRKLGFEIINSIAFELMCTKYRRQSNTR